MLINQAKCVVGFTSSDNSFKKAITARGTKTSASDAAVATLQQKGYGISYSCIGYHKFNIKKERKQDMNKLTKKYKVVHGEPRWCYL